MLRRKHQHKHSKCNDPSCPECGKIETALKRSPISYFSDLFIISMVLLWIIDNLYQSLIASAVTISSIVLSFKTGVAMYETSMWSSIGSNVAIPLSCGGAIWMIKNSVQHAIAYSKGKIARQDFPKVSVDNFEVETTEIGIEFSPSMTDEPDVNLSDDSSEIDENETVNSAYSGDEDCRG